VVLPIVPLVIVVGSSIAGGVGVVAGSVGGVQIRKAKMNFELHEARYEKRYTVHRNKVDLTNETLQAYGATQELVQRDVIYRMRDFLELHGKQVRANEHLILDGVVGSNEQSPIATKLDLDVVSLVGGLIGSTAAAAAVPIALRTAVSELGKASTGTAIKTLNGVAAENAILAFFGGGSRSTGGGGMKLGAPMLPIAGAGTGLLIAGLTVKARGTNVQTTADEHRTELDVAIANMERRDELLLGLQKWAHEQDDILIRLASQATESLNFLESEPFNIELHAERLQAALILVKSIGELLASLVVTAPIFHEDDNIDGNPLQLTLKYRDLNTESTDD
jgi:hypothetical protein